MNHRRVRSIVVICLLGLAMAACIGANPKPIIVTEVVTKVVTRVAATNAPATAIPEPENPTETPPFVPTPRLPSFQPIVFVPSNRTVDPEYASAVDSAMADVQAWFADKLGGPTIRYLPTVVIEGEEPVSFCCPSTINDELCIQIPGIHGADPPDLQNVLNELIRLEITSRLDLKLVLFWVGGYGFAGGNEFQAYLADWALDGIMGKYEDGTAQGRCWDSPTANLWCNKNAQVGAVSHEMGHTLGLDHPSSDGTGVWASSIMSGSYWRFPNVRILESTTNPERQILLDSPFIYPQD